VSTEAVSIDRAAKTVALTELKTGRTYTEAYDALILSPGAEPVKPPIPGPTWRASSLSARARRGQDQGMEDLRRPSAPSWWAAASSGWRWRKTWAPRRRCDRDEALDQVMGPIDFEMAAIVHRHLRDKDVELRSRTAWPPSKNGAAASS
jgi:NADPH-dependent 2,4-dienoyl-CoA reductase/sulfur reductase-like enzyme